jgi:hypothetical protein
VYLSRVAARQVAGHLVYEALQLISQTDSLEEAASPAAPRSPEGHTPKVLAQAAAVKTRLLGLV